MSKHSPRETLAPAADGLTPDVAAHPEPLTPSALAVPDVDDDEEDEPIPYDPAEYRWVPVRRVPRYTGWTEEKQRRFIETLADTGLVNVAARAVGMSRESAYQLRRSPHGAAFAHAWDAARQHAAGLIEDIAFERAIEGTEQEVLNRNGEVIATRLVHDNRLLKYLLSHLKPERYGSHRAAAAPRDPAEAAPSTTLQLGEHLHAMEPALPAPAETLLDPDTLADELELAEQCDGALPPFLNEQPRQKSDQELRIEAARARYRRGEAAIAKHKAGGTLSKVEFADECFYYDPIGNKLSQPRERRGTEA